MAMWSIENNGTAPVVVHDVNGTAKQAFPSKKIIVDITDRQAARFACIKTLDIRDQEGNRPGKYSPGMNKERGEKVPFVRAAAPTDPEEAARLAASLLQRAQSAVISDKAKDAPAPKRERLMIHEEVTPAPKTRKEQATDIMEAYSSQSITYSEASAKAHELLGDAWPGGTPKKSVLFELLGKIED